MFRNYTFSLQTQSQLNCHPLLHQKIGLIIRSHSYTEYTYVSVDIRKFRKREFRNNRLHEALSEMNISYSNIL